MISPTDTVLFQGDSITDGGRDRGSAAAEDVEALGMGYARLAAVMLRVDRPGVTTFNRGISGNRIGDLVDRWERDCLAIKPTVLSILIGVNDTWHGAAKSDPAAGTPLDVFDTKYRALLKETKEKLAGVRLVLCQPFVTECGVVTGMNFHPDIDQRRELVDAIATDHADVYVRFQDVFDEAVGRAEPAYWARDGVHPTHAGHMLMARAWVEAVEGS